MKNLWALSLWQPWAELVICGRKTLETRHWRSAPYHLLGQRIVIHAARKRDKFVIQWARHFKLDPAKMAWGCAIGTVLFQEQRPCRAEDEALALIPCVGKLGLVFVKPERFPEPIPVRGMLGFFPLNLQNVLDGGQPGEYSTQSL